MRPLSADQRNALVSVINQEFGLHLEFDDFADALLGLVENIAGFETTPQQTKDRFVYKLWRKYHGQSEYKEAQETRVKIRVIQ